MSCSTCSGTSVLGLSLFLSSLLDTPLCPHVVVHAVSECSRSSDKICSFQLGCYQVPRAVECSTVKESAVKWCLAARCYVPPCGDPNVVFTANTPVWRCTKNSYPKKTKNGYEPVFFLALVWFDFRRTHPLLPGNYNFYTVYDTQDTQCTLHL